ncbi:prepilin-type N-terminal cleavage/methylation domain-containing protein [Robertmurraya yapensis]|uniref:Prepilin-type N-terminal cleavage/methylation domain-containing protein n=1 Tax=Bacillus yapensis TaxID=2492960 RepID=A0A431VVM8_9BACI|nr:prepilin-type N-terminal cleavage/methylation domain-containing protein [Bacillus yapensis]RTR27328.1 prepilin-type N-terminal cleavage/methylation domain-containing protein [Bacillus yapensis]TKS94048.1 prepilin-type N-terminal cleavage/methylation domain-containing protein [Bacillus yapensis]
MDFQEEKGFTLIEILLSIVILTIILVSIMNFFPQMGLFNRHNLEKTEAINLAKKELVEWQNKFSKLTRVNFEYFLDYPSKSIIPEYEHSVDHNGTRYYIFEEKEPSTDYKVEVSLKKDSDLEEDLKKNSVSVDLDKLTKIHRVHVKILNDNNTLISEIYGYYLNIEE